MIATKNAPRIADVALGGVVLGMGLLAWFLYLSASLTGFDASESGPGVTNKDLIGAFFEFWVILWLIGLTIVLLAIVGWLHRAVTWTLLGATALMLTMSMITYQIGAR